MKIDILPTTTPAIPLAILSMTNLDNRELNPAIEKQLTSQQIPVATPQSALADLIEVIHAKHPVNIRVWDMTALGLEQVQLKMTPNGASLLDGEQVLVPNLNSKSSRVLVVIGDPEATDTTIHATGQELQRKIKVFFGIQARLQFPTCSTERLLLETTRPVS